MFCGVGTAVEEDVNNILSDGEGEEVEMTILTLANSVVVTQCEEDPLNPCLNELLDSMDITAEEMEEEDPNCECCLNPIFAHLRLQCAWHGRKNDENHSSESSQALCNEDSSNGRENDENQSHDSIDKSSVVDGVLMIPFSEISFLQPWIELCRCDERVGVRGRGRGRPPLYPCGQSPWLCRLVRPAGCPRIHPVGHQPVYIRTGRPAGPVLG
ncbi:hypothetical protein V9T40_006537 [Parthenolecanium corni]|uniref:Uncharacterized protein n=1 Tax=Parthenolecanium corni TaxID=536013 RepID=A0AAN9TMF7_9HEMI